MVQAATILSVPKPSISQRLQIKEDTVEPSVPAREFNLKAYTAITGHNDPTCLGLEPRLADHRSQAARTATLPTAPPSQASHILLWTPAQRSLSEVHVMFCECFFYIFFMTALCSGPG